MPSAPVVPFLIVRVFVEFSSSSGTAVPRPPFSSSVLAVEVEVVLEMEVAVARLKARSSMFKVVAVTLNAPVVGDPLSMTTLSVEAGAPVGV